MLETMMQQLMSKEVLYEPLKELNDKVRFPSRFIIVKGEYIMTALKVPRVLARERDKNPRRGQGTISEPDDAHLADSHDI